MADQIIFTSAVRGIKPGASGYCTVLRSPGIRPALEQALEKLSVFEHTKCNRGRVTYSYRQIEIRNTTYFALSRISDTDKDYTGRTNFLAHHLVFQKEEIPDLSPADILLTWSGWYQQWSGEPREEPVDVQSLQQIPAIKPPVRIWKEQAIGVDGAIKLASDTQSLFVLRSKECTDSSLLQLVAEALAVRAKFNQSYKYTWTTSFSVGLAAVGSAKTFKWLVVRDADDYALPKAGTLIDLDTTLPGGTTANEELSAIAREGEFRPAAKPIPLSSEKSVIDRLSTPESGGGAAPRGQRGRPVGKHEPRILKLGLGHEVRNEAGNVATSPPKKRKWLYTLVCLVILLVAAGGVWFGIKLNSKWQESAQVQIRKEYGAALQNLVLLHKEYKKKGPIDPNHVESTFRRLQDADDAKATGINKTPIINKSLVSYNQVATDNAEKAVDALWGFLQSRKNYETYLSTLIELFEDTESGDNTEEVKEVLDNMLKAANPKLDDLQDMEAIDWELVAPPYEKVNRASAETIFKAMKSRVRVSEGAESKHEEEPHDVANIESNSVPTETLKNIVILDPINLEDYDKIYFRQPGEEISINSEANFVANFKVAILNSSLGVINKKHFSNVYKLHNNGKSLVQEANGISIAVNAKIANDGLSYAVSVNSDKLIFIVGDSWNESVRVGEWNLGSSSAQNALESIEVKFDVEKIDVRLLDDGGNAAVPPEEPDIERLTEAEGVSKKLFEAMVTNSESDYIREGTLDVFEKWITAEIVSRLEKLTEKAREEKDRYSGDEYKVKEYDMLIGSYDSIIRATNDSSRIADYFTAYRSEIDILEAKMKGAKNDDKLHRNIERVRDTLNNNELSAIVKIPEDKPMYEISYEDGEWGLKYSFNAQTIQRRRGSELSKNLGQLLPKLKAVASSNQEKNEYNRALEEYKNKIRDWSLIEFRRPESGQVIATVKIK